MTHKIYVPHFKVSRKETDDEETLKGALQTYADGLEKLKNLREGLLFVGQWNGWNNADEADTYILTGEGDVKSVTLEVAADLPYFGEIRRVI